MPPLAQTILTHVIGGFINKQNLKRKSTGAAAVNATGTSGVKSHDH